MRIAIGLTLAFFAVVSALGTIRDTERLRRDPRVTRFLGVATACAVSAWSTFAAFWMLTH
jgi:hypothetical protein